MNLYQKILEVMKGVSYLSKDDTVAFGNTKYLRSSVGGKGNFHGA